MTTKYNTMYNGEVAFDAGKKEIVDTYNDNFWELLPVERLAIKDEIRFSNQAENENFERAEEKASKSIQKHSMNIEGIEKNPKMDEAFLLLGKSRYFDQRFIPALEAFNYILYKYPTSNTIDHARVWRAKTNIRLDNNEVAIKNLRRMVENEPMRDQDYADASAMIAQAYINLKAKDTAVTYIKAAAANTKSNEERGRYLYILGQLYNDLNHKDSANLAFQKVIDLNRRTPRHYMIQAHMAKARNFDYKEGDRIAFQELMHKLEKNRENRPFLDVIYHEKGNYYYKTDSVQAAIDYYNKSLRTDSQDEYLKSLNYETLATISFDSARYATAGAYLDSTLERLVVDSKRHRTLRKKRENLDDVILYEGIATNNDSILTAVSLPKNEQITYYKKFTDKLKAEAIAAQKEAEIAAANEAAEIPFESKFQQPGQRPSGLQPGGPNEAEGEFYFYDPNTVARGKSTFRRKFGKRPLEDNWRLASVRDKNSDIASEEDEESGETEEEYDINKDPAFDPETYIAQLPTDQGVLDSLATERNFAYYQLGLIYKEKFKEYDRAADRLETVLKNQPEERLILPSKYNLYKIYQASGKPTQMAATKEDILTNHGDSRYADILRNPDVEVAGDANSPEALYNDAYKKFEEHQYSQVLQDLNIYIDRFAGDQTMLPKFELLKAQTLGRLRGPSEYKKSLNFIALNYPQSPEGRKAQELYDSFIPYIENITFNQDTLSSPRNKLIYVFKKENKVEADSLKANMDRIIEELRYTDIKTSVDMYSDAKVFVVVHAHRNYNRTKAFGDLMRRGTVEDTRDKYVEGTRKLKRKRKIYYPKVEKEYMAVTSDNYRTILIQKNMDDYVASLTQSQVPTGDVNPFEPKKTKDTNSNTSENQPSEEYPQDIPSDDRGFGPVPEDTSPTDDD